MRAGRSGIEGLTSLKYVVLGQGEVRHLSTWRADRAGACHRARAPKILQFHSTFAAEHV